MHSISDLTTFCRKTAGDVPSKLVGASTTVVGSKMYLFGGRLVTERRMVSDMYIFDLETFIWEKFIPSLEDEVPGPRYFHSADIWNNQLIICGGMGHQEDATSPEDLCVLNDVRFFNLDTRRWLPEASSNSLAPDFLVPKPRYAHLSSITADRLFIIGGQDLKNIWLDDVHVYDLLGKTWVERRNYPRHVGTYRSIAVAADQRVRLPQEELRAAPSTLLGPPGTRFRTDKSSPSSNEFTKTESLIHLPYSAPPTDEFPNDIYLYSNYNFTDVKREFEVFSPLPDTDFTITDRSAVMTGTSFPPGLRFPSGAMLGTHFIVAGTYLAQTYQSFSIWALDLVTMQWSRIDPGGAVSTGSWFRGCLWADANKYMIFGNRNGNLVEDYNRRLLSWDHVAVIDLESFGIYQPPPLMLDISMQELGLAALEENLLTDFEIVCDDGRKIKCSRKILEERWPWFKEQREKFSQKAKETAETFSTSSTHVALPELPGMMDVSTTRPDPRLTPRSFQLSEPYPITLALLQYFYSLALITPLQQAPAVLSQLLVLSSTYQIAHLESLVKHAMHRMLSNSTSVGVYEVATLCNCRSLQIRALKTVMSYSQKRPSTRSRHDSKTGGGGGGTGGGGRHPDLNGGGNGHSESSTATARPRGTSDAIFRGAANPQSSTIAPSTGYSAASSFTEKKDRQSNIISVKLGMPSTAATSAGHEPASAAPMFIHRMPSTSHVRAVSVVSSSTDHDLLAMAELMSPVVADESNYTEADALIEQAIPHESGNLVRSVANSGGRFQLSTELPPNTPSSLSSNGNSVFYDSDFDQPSDCDPAYPPKSTTYPAFHLPRPRLRLTSMIDSDTPSLSTSTSFSSLGSISRSHSRRSSPPVSPTSITTPIEYQSPGIPHLAIIEERNAEDQDTPYRLSMESAGSLIALKFGTPGLSSMHIEDPSKQHDLPNLKRRMPALEHLKLDSMVPAHKNGLQSSSLHSPALKSPAPSSDSGIASLSSSQTASRNRVESAVSFPQFLGGRAKNKSEEKQRKAEDKKRKKAEAKAEAKAKSERLAMELQEKARQRAAALEEALSQTRKTHSDGNPQWVDTPPMFGGVNFVFGFS